MMNNPLGIMQGRLTPPIRGKIQAFPKDLWEVEFHQAKEIGLDLIDWIVERENLEHNPFMSPEGKKAIQKTMALTGVKIGAVCADYFMDCPLIRCSAAELQERLDFLEVLIRQLASFEIPYLEIPFVDNSAIRDIEEMKHLVRVIKPLRDLLSEAGVTLAFETSLPPKQFQKFLAGFDHPSFRANYDMGNSASLGYNAREELSLYGDKVVTVHIKDRVLHGGTVPLGTGNTDFSACFSQLENAGYSGPFILQVARGNEEIEWTKKNMAFARNFLHRGMRNV